MNVITVNASTPYNCFIEDCSLFRLGERALLMSLGKQACIISDSNVSPLYGKDARHYMESAGFKVTEITFPAGEGAKSFENYQKCIKTLAQEGFTRDDFVIALGGGVIGDLAGFVAATYMRGLHLIQVPTSLLAMVDSSIGGKNGVNLDAGKNLVGTIKQPDVVVIDPLLLRTLDEFYFTDGCAEMIKYGIIEGGRLYQMMSTPFTVKSPGLAELITECVKVKADIVSKDEMDTNARLMLNLGHTFGHAFEKLSGYTIGHGHAVACGTIMACYLAQSIDPTFDEHLITELKLVYASYGLPITIETCVGRKVTANELYEAILMDKKRQAGCVRVVVPSSVGHCAVKAVPLYDFEAFINRAINTHLM